MPKTDYRSDRAKEYRHLYKDKRWSGPNGIRLQQLRKQPLCERCLKQGKVVAATVAHHLQAHKGNEHLFFDPNNLASSCKPCHDTIEQSIERLGYEKGCDAEGWPVDPKHPWSS